MEDLQKEISNIRANKRVVRKRIIKKKNALGNRRRNQGADLKGKSPYIYLRLR